MRCKWGRRVEFIKNNFIPVLQFGINFGKFSLFFIFGFFPFLFLLFFYSFFFALSSFHSFHSWSAGAFSPSDPAPWKGRVTHLRRAHQIYFWYSSAVESSVLGTVGPSRKCCPRKSGTPQSGLLEIHARVQQVVLFQVDRKHRQEFRQSSFPFLERTFTGSPSEYERFPPLPETNPKTHGVLAGQDSVPQGRSQGRAWSIDKIRDRTGRYSFTHHNSSGTRIIKWWRHYRQVRMLRLRTAHARSKKKDQNGDSNHGHSRCV